MFKTGLKNIVLVSTGIIVGTGIIVAVNANPIDYTYYLDIDGDGYGTEVATTTESDVVPEGYAALTGDCDDVEAATNPGAEETCDGVDNNCSGEVDEGVLTTFYHDTDGDFFGNDASSTEACVAPVDYVPAGGDCDEGDVAINPDAEEVCDLADNNCDGQIDEGVMTTFFLDLDGDLFGDDSASTTEACSASSDYVASSTDCDDTDAGVNPDAIEILDSLDNNCNGQVDEGFVPHTYYMDADSDNYGDPLVATSSTIIPVGYVSNNGDCDDSDSSIHPGATEVLDSADNNCNGETDEGFELQTYYMDADDDGYGDPQISTTSYESIDGYVLDDSDCDDDDENTHPGATELDDDIDNNCDGQIDEDFILKTYYMDADDDGYGDPQISTTSYESIDGYVLNDSDCDDDDENTHPGATELDDDIDNNCDGMTDEGFEDPEPTEPGDCDDYNNHGQYVSAWTHYLNNLKKEGIIKNWKKGELLKKKAHKKLNEECGWEKKAKKPEKHKKHVKPEKPEKHEKHVKHEHKKHKKHGKKGKK